MKLSDITQKLEELEKRIEDLEAKDDTFYCDKCDGLFETDEELKNHKCDTEETIIDTDKMSALFTKYNEAVEHMKEDSTFVPIIEFDGNKIVIQKI